MTKILIAAGGKAGAGKDYILEHLTQYHAGQSGIVRIGGFGDLVRRELREMFAIPDPSRREQQIHGQRRRQEDQDYWPKRAVEWANGFRDDIVVGFTGVRFLNEVAVLQDGGLRVGLVEAPLEVRKARLEARDGRPWTAEELNDVTETSLDQIPRSAWDWIWNNG